MAKKKYNYSFKNGWNLIPIGKAEDFKNKAMEILGLKNVQSLYKAAKENQSLSIVEYIELNKLFNENGITDMDAIWEITPVE